MPCCGTANLTRHLTETVTGFLENALHCENLVAELKLYAGKTLHSDTPPPGCACCDLGEHPTTGEQRWAPHVSAERNGVSIADRCNCRRGAWFRAQDERRRAMMQAAKATAAKRTGAVRRSVGRGGCLMIVSTWEGWAGRSNSSGGVWHTPRRVSRVRRSDRTRRATGLGARAEDGAGPIWRVSRQSHLSTWTQPLRLRDR